MMRSAKRKKLIYASPFQPMRSGISDYSEVLIYGLKRHFDVTLLIDDYRLSNKKLYRDFDVLVYRNDQKALNSFDFRIYNIGNNPHFHCYIYEAAINNPGLIILHDAVLYYLIVGYYKNREILYSKIYELAGAAGINMIKKYTKRQVNLLECKHLAPLLALNTELINSNNKIMVHSNYTYQQVSRIIDNQTLLRKINMVDHVELIRENKQFISKKRLFQKYDIPEGSIVLSSFGVIGRTKLNHIVCRTLKLLNDRFDNRVIYLMVGEGNYVDEYLNTSIRKTGYVSSLEFNSFIKYSDVVVNLRYPSMGETSSALIRALGIGKPCIVSNSAWFSELPDDVVIKLNNTNIKKELENTILDFLNDPEKFKKLGENARAHIEKGHNLQHISKQIAEFIL